MKKFAVSLLMSILIISFISCPFPPDEKNLVYEQIDNWTEISINEFCTVGDDIYISGIVDSLNTGMELYKYSSSGLELAADIAVGSESSQPHSICQFGDNLYFMASSGAGTVIWEYNGTDPPQSFTDKFPDFHTTYQSSLAIFENKLFFVGWTNSGGYDLYSFNGTDEPVMERDLAIDLTDPGSGGNMFVFSNRLYIYLTNDYYNTGSEYYLCSYDGSSVSVVLADGNAPYFNAPIPDYEVFKSDSDIMVTMGMISGSSELVMIDSSHSASVITSTGSDYVILCYNLSKAGFSISNGNVFFYQLDLDQLIDSFSMYNRTSGTITYITEPMAAGTVHYAMGIMNYENTAYTGMNEGLTSGDPLTGFEIYYLDNSNSLALTEGKNTGIENVMQVPLLVQSDRLLIGRYDYSNQTYSDAFWLYFE